LIEILFLIGKDHFWDVTGGFTEKYNEALKRKEEGNVFYSQKNFRCANKKYKKALKFLEYDSDFKEDEKQKAKQIKLFCYNNLAASKLKCHKWQKALEYATEAVKIDPNNVKALYRQGKALMELGEWNEAKEKFQSVLRVDPKNVTVMNELHNLKERERVHKQKNAKAVRLALQEMANEREAQEKIQRALERKRKWQQIKRLMIWILGIVVVFCVLIVVIRFMRIPFKRNSQIREIFN
jgi:tetratricopeptide (TPR) repeat protein